MGLPLACAFGKQGADVTVVDIDPALIASIEAGRCPYDEPGLTDLMAELHRRGGLHATGDTAHAASSVDEQGCAAERWSSTKRPSASARRGAALFRCWNSTAGWWRAVTST
jgi:hypothetical protein